MPEIKIKRKKQLFAPANCCFHVYIDGEKQTTLSNGDRDTLNVAEGTHTLQINNNWFTGKKLSIEIRNEDQVYSTHSRSILGVLYVLAPVILLVATTLKLFKVVIHPMLMSFALMPLFIFIILAVLLGLLKEAIVVKKEA